MIYCTGICQIISAAINITQFFKQFLTVRFFMYVFSISVVFDLQESDVVIIFNKVVNSWISFFRKLFSTSSDYTLSFNIPISWGHLFLLPSTLLDLWLISAKPKVLSITFCNFSKRIFDILSIFLSKFTSEMFRSSFVAVILIGISFWFTNSSYILPYNLKLISCLSLYVLNRLSPSLTPTQYGTIS